MVFLTWVLFVYLFSHVTQYYLVLWPCFTCCLLLLYLFPHPTRLTRELQEKEKVIEVLQAKLDARSLTPSSSHALSDSQRTPSSSSFLSDELDACSDMDVASEYTHFEEKKVSPGPSGKNSSNFSELFPLYLGSGKTPQNSPWCDSD